MNYVLCSSGLTLPIKCYQGINTCFHKKNILLLFLPLLLFISCNNKNVNPSTLFTLQLNSGISFTNTVNNTPDFNIFSYRNFYNGGGCAIGDINNDGLADVYFTANQGSNKLFLNRGNFKFEDITLQSGTADSTNWSTGVVMVDINHDGWLDIYVCNAGYVAGKAPESKLFINNRNLSFTDSAAAYGLSNKGGYATHAAFFDYDKDGDLDCFIINNSFIPTNNLNYADTRIVRAKDWPVKDFLKGGGDRFLKNDNGKFTDISEQAGIYGSLISFGLGVTVGDINNDGWEDVYVSNDFFERDYVYINQKNGKFKDEYETYIQHSSHSSMGADMCDVNNDGYPDIFTTEMLPAEDYRVKTTSSFESIDVNKLKIKSGFGHQYMQNTLQLNNGNGKFLETAFYSGVAASDWSWGGLIFDADNNSLPDIFVCNGIYKDVTDQDFIEFFADEINQKMALTGEKTQQDAIIEKMPSVPIANKMFANTDGLHFTAKEKEWGLATPSFSNGAAYGDLDNDGDLDMIVNNVNMPGFVYKNNAKETTASHSISIRLKGAEKNSFAIGSKVKVFCGKEMYSRELQPARGFQSSVDYRLVIGLGTHPKVDSIHIIWPDNTYLRDINPAIDTLNVYEEKYLYPKYEFAKNYSKPLFDSVKNFFDRHVEDDYTDFYNERNIPVMLSHEGPKAAVADVNGDGLDDVFICGASLQPGQVYIQSSTGNFSKMLQPALLADAAMEDVCPAFFDADNDGDTDLMVGSGGNNHPAGSKEYATRLYINDGKGNFTMSLTPVPSTGMNSSCLAVNDFDGDGDMDVFVASKSVPGSYGETPFSSLLVNDGKGNFTDAAKTQYQNIASVGNISSVVWCSVFANSKKDLVVTGEWMAPRVFSYNGKEFIEQKTSLSAYKGLWQSLAAADLDGDGDDDLVLGNISPNFNLYPNSLLEPVKLWINDFDNNGTKDKILTKTINGKDIPVFNKKEITEQMPGLKKQNLKNHEYAKKTLQDLFSSNLTGNATVKEFNYSSSILAINTGNGNFSVKELPWQAQLSCINSILVTDINKDGQKDILLGSNKFDLMPQFGRLDAAFGIALVNKGNNDFYYLPQNHAGIGFTGCVRDIKNITINKQPHYLWLRNDDFPVLIKPAK